MSELDTRKPNSQDDLADVKTLIGNADGAKAQVLVESLLSKHSFFVLRPAQIL